jgi:hypothetical protein
MTTDLIIDFQKEKDLPYIHKIFFTILKTNAAPVNLS